MVQAMTMICRCNDEGAAEADALMARCREALGSPDPADFLSALIMELNQQYDAFVSMIAADQWFGVTVRQLGEIGTDEDTWLSFTFECDRVEDGLVACWEALQKKARSGEKAEEARNG